MKSEFEGEVEKKILDELQKLRKAIDDQTSVLRASLLPPDRHFTILYNDHKILFYLPRAESDLIQRSILRTSCFYELPVLRAIADVLGPNSFVVDAGANIGNHALFFSIICKAAAVYAFEPQRYVFDILEKNIEANRVENCFARNIALGAANARAGISRYGSNNLGGTSFTLERAGGYEVRSLDSFDLSRVDLLKIDVEGAQLSVLQGARETLKRDSPIILCELRPDRDDDDGTEAFLKGFNYTRSQINRTNALFRKV